MHLIEWVTLSNGHFAERTTSMKTLVYIRLVPRNLGDALKAINWLVWFWSNTNSSNTASIPSFSFFNFYQLCWFIRWLSILLVFIVPHLFTFRLSWFYILFARWRILFDIFLSEIVSSFSPAVFLCMQVYVIDYGLAKRYRDLQTHKHIPYR